LLPLVIDPLLYILAVATILATPGPTNTLMATAGSTLGVRRALPLLAAELSGYLLSIMAIRLALAPVVQMAPALGIAVKVAVSVYLVWLAVKVWRSAGRVAVTGAPVAFVDVFVTTLFNPKALIFALTVIPHEHPGLGWYIAGFAVLVLAAGGGWIAIGAALAAAAGRRAVYVQRVASVVLVGFAGLILRSVV
jgi:threonine/homoserine/homoserine lactone efflux protein